MGKSSPLNNNVQSPSLDTTFAQLREAFSLVLHSKMSEAEAVLEPDAPTSMYNTFGLAIVKLFNTIALEPKELKNSMSALKTCLASVSRGRRAKSWVWTPNYAEYSDEEAHAELVHSETNFLLALVSVFEDRSFVGFVNAALYLRTAHKGYKDCLEIYHKKANWTSPSSKDHFESGVRLGVGAFDVAISFLPGRLVTLLEYVGFTGDRQFGLSQLIKAAHLQEGMRYPFVVAVLIVYLSFSEYLFGLGESDPVLIDRICSEFLGKFPNCSYSNIIRGIQKIHEGQLDKAIEYFNSCVGSSEAVNKIEAFVTLLNFWCHIFIFDFEGALKQSETFASTNWSPASGLFAQALTKFHVMDNVQDPNEKRLLISEVCEMLKGVPGKKKNFGGKKAFHEKFILEKSLLYSNCPEKMVLPLYEDAYIFNYFQLFARDAKYVQPISDAVDAKLSELDEDSESYFDKLSSLTFLKGVCLKQFGQFEEAISTFCRVIELENKVTDNMHLAPQACYEIGNIHRRGGAREEAKDWLRQALKYTNYYTEMMIKYRSQVALDSMKAKLKRHSTQDIFDLN